MRKQIVGVLALLMVIGCVQGRACASDAVGWVQKASGAVTLESGGKSVAAKAGDGVHSRDILVTGPRSKAQIMFKDKTTLALAENSRCAIGDVYLDAGDTKSAALHVRFLKGAFGMLLGAIAKLNPSGFKAETPLVALGVRGTEFASAVAEDIESHGLYAGGPVVVKAGAPPQTSPQPAGDTRELCEELEDAVRLFEKAYRSKRSVGRHDEAKTYAAKAEEFERLVKQHNCR